jgi:hypothetical protein
LAYGERAIAALCASLATHQPVAALARRFSQRGIHNLNEFLIDRWKGSAHAYSI